MSAGFDIVPLVGQSLLSNFFNGRLLTKKLNRRASLFVLYSQVLVCYQSRKFPLNRVLQLLKQWTNYLWGNECGSQLKSQDFWPYSIVFSTTTLRTTFDPGFANGIILTFLFDFAFWRGESVLNVNSLSYSLLWMWQAPPLDMFNVYEILRWRCWFEWVIFQRTRYQQSALLHLSIKLSHLTAYFLS